MRLRRLKDLSEKLGLAATASIPVVVALFDVVAMMRGEFSVYVGFPTSPTLAAALGAVTSTLLLVAGVPALTYRRRLFSALAMLPSALHDVVAGMESGMPLTEAVKRVGLSRAYGFLGTVFAEIAARLEYGDSFEEAVQILAQEIPHPYAQKTASVLVYAHRAGERAADVLRHSIRLLESVLDLRADYVNRVRPHATTIAFTYAVYLTSSYIISKIFVPSLMEASGFVAMTGVELLPYHFYWLGYMISIFTGAFYAKMVYGSYMPGLAYSALMLAITTAFFYFFVLTPVPAVPIPLPPVPAIPFPRGG